MFQKSKEQSISHNYADQRGRLDVKRLRNANLVLTTYETVRDFQLDLGVIPWAAVVIDEAQRIKTPGTLVTNALKALKTDFRLALTGTPVENSLMDFVVYHRFRGTRLSGQREKF